MGSQVIDEPSQHGAGPDRDELTEAVSPPTRDFLVRMASKRTPWVVGATVWLAGFGVLSLWYWVLERTGGAETELRGLFDFGSVMIGDALLLPVAAGIAAALHRMIDDFLIPHPQDPSMVRTAVLRAREATSGVWTSWVPPVTSLLLTVALHGVWLRDPTFINWTVPEAGRLNGAGWYHAAFFWVVVWWFFSLTIRLIAGVAPVLVAATREFDKNGLRAAKSARIWFHTNAILLCVLAFSVGLLFDYRTGLNSSLSLAGLEWSASFLSTALSIVAVQVFFGFTVWLPATKDGGDCWEKVREDDRGSVLPLRRPLVAVVALPAILVVILSPWVIAWAVRQLGASWPVVFSGVVLPLLFAENVWSELYHQQARPLHPTSWLVIGASFLGSSAALLSGLAITLDGRSPLQNLSAQFAPWWQGFAISLTGILIVSGLVVCLCSLEEGLPIHIRGWWTPMRPRNDLLMDYAQFWALHQLIIVTATVYVVRLQDLMNLHFKGGDVISLLYGFTGLAALAIMLPLRMNMNYVAKQEKTRNALKHHDIQHSIVMTVLTAAIAVSTVIWLWIAVFVAILG